MAGAIIIGVTISTLELRTLNPGSKINIGVFYKSFSEQLKVFNILCYNIPQQKAEKNFRLSINFKKNLPHSS